jgi:hypothetical protein
LKSLGEPPVLIFPKLFVCVQCGFTDFRMPEKDLVARAAGDVATESAP